MVTGKRGSGKWRILNPWRVFIKKRGLGPSDTYGHLKARPGLVGCLKLKRMEN